MRYTFVMNKVDRLERKLARLDDRKIAIQAGEITGMPKGGKNITLEDLLVQAESTNERINKHMVKAREIREEIEDVIDNLPNPFQSTVLDMYFIERKSLYEIAKELTYSYRYINKTYADGVKSCKIK